MKPMMKKSLEEAFAGESQAHMKYLIFANVAEKEGMPNIARLFRATAYAEQVHATNHAQVMQVAGKTAENLQKGIDGETFEFEDMYPAYRAIAEEVGDSKAKRAIFYAEEAEKVHADYYSAAREKAQNGQDIGEEKIYVNPVCGYTHIGEPEDKCPICNVSKDKFSSF